MIKLPNYLFFLCRSVAFLVVLTLLVVVVGSPPVLAEVQDDLAQGYAILAKYKSSAEGQAKILVGLDAEEDISKKEYRKGQSLYVEAKAGFDGWIDQLIFLFQAGKTELLSPQYESIQREAKTKGDAFTKYVQDLFLGNPRGEVGDGFKSVFASIKEVGSSMLKGFTKVSPTEQPEVIKKLEGYKWPEFHIIKKSL